MGKNKFSPVDYWPFQWPRFIMDPYWDARQPCISKTIYVISLKFEMFLSFCHCMCTRRVLCVCFFHKNKESFYLNYTFPAPIVKSDSCSLYWPEDGYHVSKIWIQTDPLCRDCVVQSTWRILMSWWTHAFISKTIFATVWTFRHFWSLSLRTQRLFDICSH